MKVLKENSTQSVLTSVGADRRKFLKVASVGIGVSLLAGVMHNFDDVEAMGQNGVEWSELDPRIFSDVFKEAKRPDAIWTATDELGSWMGMPNDPKVESSMTYQRMLEVEMGLDRGQFVFMVKFPKSKTIVPLTATDKGYSCKDEQGRELLVNLNPVATYSAWEKYGSKGNVTALGMAIVATDYRAGVTKYPSTITPAEAAGMTLNSIRQVEYVQPSTEIEPRIPTQSISVTNGGGVGGDKPLVIKFSTILYGDRFLMSNRTANFNDPKIEGVT